MNKRDVIICGAGPAGSSLAYFLSREGFDVLLLDKAKFPRAKPCGGAFSVTLGKFFPFSLEHVVEDKATGFSFVKDGRCCRVKLDRPMTYIVDRKKFDNFLLKQAINSGVVFIEECKVLKFEKECVYTKLGKFSGKILVGAEGVGSVIRKFGKYGRIKSMLRTISADVPFDFKKELVFDFSYAKIGYAWIFPKGNKVNVGLGNLSDCFRDGEGNFFRILDDYGFPRPLNIYKWTYPIFSSPESLTWKNTLLIGDAASLVDPLTGAGIYNAVQSAYFASKAISLNLREGVSLKSYQNMIKKNIYLNFYLSLAVRYMFKNIPLNIQFIKMLRPFLTFLAKKLS
jgi:geranylgeranyl reductase family protein